MQLMILTAVVDGFPSGAASFDIAVDGGAFQPADTSFLGTWRSAAQARRFPGFGFRFDHLFPSTLLTDALRRSGF